MLKCMGVINLSNEIDTLEELTLSRCPAAIPFGGRYRLIDFVLSNMVNAGIQNVGIFAYDRYRSLMEHLGSGKEWDLDRKRDGLFIFPPTIFPYPDGFKGDVQNFFGHLEYFKRSPQEFVVVSGSTMVYNFNYAKVMEYHLAKGADITILYQDGARVERDTKCRVLETGRDDRVIWLADSISREVNRGKVSMDCFFMKKSLLIQILEVCIRRDSYDFVRDGITANLDLLKVVGFPFTGYLAVINSVDAYYKRSLDLLNPQVWRELFFQRDRILTKTKNEPPTKYTDSSEVGNTLLGNGCLIEGKVQNSILFRGVRIRKGAVVKNSVILQRCDIEGGALVEGAVLEKDVRVSGRAVLRGNGHPVMVGKGRLI